MEQSTMSISCVCACAHVISVSLCVMDDDVACLASVITPCISRCARIWFTDASASCSFASMIWVAIATDPYFATSSLFVIHRRDPNWRCLFFCLICRKNSECLQAPSHEAHCSMRTWSFALSLCALRPARWISTGVFGPQVQQPLKPACKLQRSWAHHKTIAWHDLRSVQANNP